MGTDPRAAPVEQRCTGSPPMPMFPSASRTAPPAPLGRERARRHAVQHRRPAAAGVLHGRGRRRRRRGPGTPRAFRAAMIRPGPQPRSRTGASHRSTRRSSSGPAVRPLRQRRGCTTPPATAACVAARLARRTPPRRRYGGGRISAARGRRRDDATRRRTVSGTSRATACASAGSSTSRSGGMSGLVARGPGRLRSWAPPVRAVDIGTSSKTLGRRRSRNPSAHQPPSSARPSTVSQPSAKSTVARQRPVPAGCPSRRAGQESAPCGVGNAAERGGQPDTEPAPRWATTSKPGGSHGPGAPVQSDDPVRRRARGHRVQGVREGRLGQGRLRRGDCMAVRAGS